MEMTTNGLRIIKKQWKDKMRYKKMEK